ncbi:uncharacterized protein syne2b isoform X2 [Phycodurus eques]|uniref:uncharacterized protein syne2b isoform X2 n=1 Tax=Phycodurus eques TaxID=693459 RepID=UPI002ACE7C07|nr:uncharacterized protein syne2b isoform X2 [Phycodurus eques]
MFSPCMRGFSPGTPVSSHISKTCMGSPDRKAQEVSCWLLQAYEELLEGWDSTQGESYSERYHVFQTFVVSFNEQRRPIVPLLTAMRRSPTLSEEQRALREAWDALTEKLREYKLELDVSLPAPLDSVAHWLLRTEGVLAEEEGDPQDHGRAADQAKEKQEQLKVCLEEMPQQVKTFQAFQNQDEDGNMLVPTEKMEDLKRRFTSVRVSAKYHGIKLDYREHRHTVLDLLSQIRTKVNLWKSPYLSPEAVRVLLHEWHEVVTKQELPSMLEAALLKLKQVSEKYSCKSALAADYHHVCQQVTQLEEDTVAILVEVNSAKNTLGRVLTTWDSYSDGLSAMQAWLEDVSAGRGYDSQPMAKSESVAEWGSRQAHLNQVANFLMESTDPQTSRSLEEELLKLNVDFDEFVQRNAFDCETESNADIQTRPRNLQALIREAKLLLQEPVETMSGPLRTYRKRIQLVLMKIKEVDLEAHDSSPEFPVDQLQKLKMAMSDIKKTMCEAEQVCVELQHSISGLDSRLAELLHWETEAMEMYQLLTATQRQQQRGQDPRARVLISRGLQLEGQVVTEEQDLQVLIMTNQKSSPIQCIQTATMQDRVRAALSKSQEAVCMLSSMGARRDISRSPTGGPPSKVFLQAKSKPHQQRQSDTMLPPREFSSSLMEFHPSQETFVPKIVVQEYREEKKSLPPCSSAQEMTQAESQTQVWTEMSEQQQTAEDTLIPQLLSRGTGQQETKCHQPQVEAKGEGERNQRQKEVHQEGEHQLAEMKEYKGGQYGLTHVEFETKLQHKSETHKLILSVKKPLSPQELQCKKAQALKNRPWLHKMAQQNIQSLNKNSVQEPVQAQTDKDVVGFIQEVPYPTETSRKQSEVQDKSDRQATQQKEQPQQIQNQQKQKGKEQPFVATQHKENLNKTNTKDLSLEQSQPPVHILVQSQVQLQPSPDGQVVAQGPTWAQVRPLSPMQDTIRPPVPSHIQLGSHPQSWAPVRPSSSKPPAQLAQSQAKPETLVKVQPNAQPRPQPENQAQTILQHQTHIHPQTQTQIPAHAMTQHHGSNPGSMMQAQTQSQVQTQPQKYAQQMAQSQAKAEPLTNVQNHPPSKAQSRKYTHSVTQSHTKTETMALIQTPTQPNMEYLMHTQPASSSQGHGQPTSQTFVQPKLQPSPTQHLTQGQPVLQPRGHPVTQYYTQSQPAVQDPGHAAPGQLHPWTQVSSASSMSTQNQASVQLQHHPQNYFQPQPLSQQWAPVQEPQNKDFIQQRHHIPPAFPQPICQAHSQIPQWAQGSHPQKPQMDESGPSNMAQLYNQPQMQLHSHTQVQAHTLSQMGPQSQQQPQIQPYDVALMQTQQGHPQQQMWMQVPHHVQTHPYLQAQQCPPVEHQLQTQHQLRLNILAQIPQQLNQTNLQYPTQSQLQPYLRLQSQPHIQTQVNVQPHIQLRQFKPQPHQPPPQFRPLAQAPNQPQAPSLPPYIPQPPPPKMLSSTQSQTQSLLQYKPEPPVAKQLTIKPSTQMKTQSLPQNKLEPQRASQPKFQSPNQAKAMTLPQYMPEQVTAQPKVQPSPQPKTQFLPQYKPELQLTPQPKVPPPTQGSAISVSKPSIEPQLPQMNNQQPVKPATSSPLRLQPQVETPPEFESQSPAQANFQVNLLPQLQPQSQAPPQFNEKQSQTLLKSSVCVLPQSQAGSPDLCMPPPALAQAPPQAYSEAYAKAQALARNGFEEAKHCLQEHILEAISDKCLPAEQASLTNSLRTLDPDLLEEFLRAAKGMEAFCTPSQLRDMDFFTQSVRSQWEACFSSEGQVAQAGHQVVALQELCDMLSPEDAHRLPHTQLRECESSLAAIQRQFSGDQEAPLPDSRIPVVFDVERTIPIETAPSGKPQIPSEVSQMKLKTVNSGQEEVENHSSVEEVNKKEALEKYENYKKSLQVQLSKNEQSIRDVPSDSVTLKGLHTRLQEIQFLRQDTESLWSEFINQCSQLSGNAGVDQEKSDLQDQWQAQQSNLQRRGSLLSAALRQIDSTENHMVDFTDRLDRYLRQPKDITAFTLANTNILKDIKELDENIQSELDQLARLERESSNLDPRDCLPLSREVEAHRSSVDQLRQQVRKSEAAARALDRFLMSLRTVEEDIAGVQGAPCSEAVVLQDCRAKLALIRQSVDSLKDKAPELDLLLQGARLTVTRNGSPASCLDMVSVLLNKLEEADSGLVGQQQSLKRETHSKSLGLKKRTLFGELSKLQNTIESRGLTEATMPAVQHRFRALCDLEDQVQTQNSQIQSLRELPECQGQGQNLLEELETEYNKTLTSLTDRKQQCSILIELLKKFQSCRSHLNSTVQRAEQTISEQASYMGKDNLHKIITKVQDIKKELSGLSEQMDEMRGVCRQLQSQLKKFPDCREAPFEAEADTLMDTWLDITEKIDTYMDNLQVGLELWNKQLMLGGEIDSWTACKLALFAESHPFHSRQQVLAMKDEIQAYEENIEHFHKKSEEIQEILQSHEAPLELQVMETQLKKRMEQVKELFADCADIFEELMVVKKHLAEKIEACLSAVEKIQFSVNEVQASEPRLETQLKDLCDDLEVQEEHAKLALSEIALVSSVASSQVLEELSVDCGRLTDAITRIKDMIHLKREEKDKGLLKVIQDERQSFEYWFQDLQLAVNECFENPESRADIETSLQRLTSFLKASDAERRLEQLRDHLERGNAQIDTQQLSELSDWLKEQHEEVHTFKTHCLNRQKQIESLHCDLSSLQTQHDSFHEWLQGKEKLSAVPGTAKHLLQDLQHESQRVDILVELLASVRHQGVRADRILKDSDNVIQRYRNLEARLQTQAEEHDVSGGQLNQFATQAEHIRTWFKDLLCSVTSACEDLSYKEMSLKAEAVLSARPEGDTQMNRLRLQSQSLCEQDQLEQSRKQEVQQSVRNLEDEWRIILQAAEDVLNKTEMQVRFNQEVEALKAQSENLQSWINNLTQNLQSYESLQDVLLSKPDMQSKLQHLKERGQSLCKNLDLDEGLRHEIRDVMRGAEEEWRYTMKAVEEAKTEASAEREVAALRSNIETARSWIREQRCKLLSFGTHMPLQERLQIIQAVFSCRDEGESKVLDLKREAEHLWKTLDDSRKPELALLVEDTEQQWKSVLQTCKEAQLRSLGEDFEAQSKNTQSWVRERELQLQSVGIHSPPQDRRRMAQDVLQSKSDGDCQVNNLRRRGQTLFDRQDVEEDRKWEVQQAVQDAEEQWRKVLQVARQLEEDAGSLMNQEMEARDSELREFQTVQQETSHWLSDLQHQLDSLSSQTTVQDRLHATQTIVSAKSDGDCKLQELKRRFQSLCAQELEQPQELELQKIVQDTEDQWTRTHQGAKAALDAEEKQMALERQLKEHEEAREQVQAWLEDKRQNLISLHCYKDSEVTIKTAQAILSSKPEGDCKMAELQKQNQNLCDRDDVKAATMRESGQAVKALDELWRSLLRDAENSLNKAEVVYSLSRQLQAFFSQAASTETWLEELQTQLENIGMDIRGSQAQIENRLNTTHIILSSKSCGESRVMDLQRRKQSLCEHKDLEEDSSLKVQTKVKKVEEQWRTVLQVAESRSRQLQSVQDHLMSCRYQRGQAEALLAELQMQTSDLPRIFPWPGLGERRTATEQAQTLLDRGSAMGPLLSNLRTQAAKLYETTQDPEWADTTCGGMEDSIPVLLRELTEAVTSLEHGIMVERQFTQLVEQHEAAQDWLREQVKGLEGPPDDRPGLHSAINTLKALLQTVHREQREMKELDTARDDLVGLCTPGGRDALILEVSHLYELCAISEQDVRERLMACEARLQELYHQAAHRTKELKERAATLQWELSSLDQALGYAQPQSGIHQLRQHWKSVQNCEKSLEELRVKIDELNQEVTADSELPTEVSTTVDSLRQQQDSLESRLREHQQNCSTNTAHCLSHSLQALQDWNHSKPSKSITSLQETADEGEKLQALLREVFYHQQFLSDCLNQDVFDQLSKEGADTLREAGTLQMSLCQILKELTEKNEQKTECQLIDVVDIQIEEMKTSLVALPQKNKHSPEKKSTVKIQPNIPSTETSTSDQDDLSITSRSGEQTEATLLKEIKVIPKMRKSETQEGSTLLMLTYETVCMETKEVKCETLDKGQEEVIEQSQVIPARGKPTFAETPRVEEDIEHQISLSSNDQNTTFADDADFVAMRSKATVPSYLTITSLTTPDLRLDHNDESIVEKKESPLDDTESAEVAQFVTGIIESAIRDVDLLSKKDPLELERRQIFSASQVVTEMSEGVIVEEGKISPHTRKFKSVKFSPQLSKKEKPIMTKEESDLDPFMRKTDDKEHSLCEEAQKASGSVEFSAIAEFVTGIIESAMRDVDIPSQNDQLKLERRKTSSVSQVATRIPEVVEEGKILPPTSESKSVKYSPQLPKKEETMVPKEESNLEPVEEKTQDENEYRICEEARRDSVSVEGSVVAEFGTAFIESAIRDVDSRSQKDPPEVESVKTSSAPQVVTGIPKVILVEGKLSPPTRKSKSLTPTPQMPKKENAGVTKEDSNLEPRKEKHQDDKEHEHVCEDLSLQKARKDSVSVDDSAVARFITGLIESALRDVDLRSQKDLLELESRKKSSAPQDSPEVVIVAEGEITPPKRKSKSVKLHFEEVTVSKQTSSYSRDQTETTTPQPPKRKSKSSTASPGILKKGPKKTKELDRPSSNVGIAKTTVEEGKVVAATAERVKISPETQKLPTRRKSKDHDVPSVPTDTDIAISEGFGPGSGVKPTTEHVKTTPDAAVFGDRKLSPPKRKSKLLKVSTEPKKRKDQTITKEEPNILKFKEAKHDETISEPVEESTSEMLDNVMESDVTKLSVLADQPPKSQTVTEMSFAEQTMIPTPTVIELKLLETTRERPEEAKDHKVLLKVGVGDANTDLENTSLVLDRIPGSADVNTLELNVQNQVKDENPSVVSNTEQRDMVQGQSSVVLATLQPNVTELIEIVLCEKAVEKTCQTEALEEVLELNQEGLTETEEHEASKSTDAFQDTPMTIHMGPDVHLLQVEIRACQEEQKNKLETGKKEKSTTDKSQVEKREMSTERHKNGAQSDACKPVSLAFDPDQPSGTKKDEGESNLDNKPPQLIQTALERPKEDIHQVQLSIHDRHISPASFLEQEEIQMTVIHEKEPRQESSVKIEITSLNKGDIQPINSSIRVTQEAPECLTETLSHPDVETLSKAQTEDQKSNATKEEADNLINSTSVQKGSGKVVRSEPQDVPHTGSTTTTFEKNEASVEQSELDIDTPERSLLTEIFSGTKAIIDMELLNEEACEDCLAELMTSPSSDLDGLLCRLVSNLLSCKNHSAELQLAAMSQQVKEAEKCRAIAQDQASLLCQQREAEADRSKALKYMEDQWSAAAQDAIAVIQNKVDQLQVVQEFCHQTHKAKTTLERLAAQLDVLRLSQAESGQEEANRLNFMKRTLEEKRTVLGELLGIHTKLYPLLSRAHQAAAKSMLQTRHQEWRELERAVEKALHHADVQSHSCSSLLLELSHLRGHLESISEEPEAEHPEVSLWDCKKAKQLMMAHAEVKGAHVKYLHLKEMSEALPPSLWPKETVEIKKALLNVKDQLCLTEERMSSQIQKSSNPVIKKVMTLWREWPLMG